MLRDKGSAPQTWYFSLRFRNDTDENQQNFFFRFFRDYSLHFGEKIIPLQLNWFVNGVETPVDHPAMRLREVWIDKERGLMARRFESGSITTRSEPSASRIAEQFYEDVLKCCFGIG